MSQGSLPILDFLDPIVTALRSHAVTILQASPGAGKSTEVPLRILQIAQKKILLLEPRRVAARSLAQFLSKKLGESPGQSVGYRMRGETKVSSRTKLEIITEGLLTRMILDDPGLEGIEYILFDEFHERSLQSDVSLAMVCEVQKHLRPDLRILIMSATLEGGRLKALFPESAMIEVPGRTFPVETFYRGRPPRVDDEIVAATKEALRRVDGDVLVFLPGRSEIERCKNRLSDKNVFQLTADTPADETQKLFELHDTQRVILSTSVAETSVTLPSVRAVVDSGLSRYAIFNSESGMNELVTRRSPESVAEQRRGRAGRVAAGICFRLWADGEQLLPALEPEILRADLSSAVLDLLVFGAGDPKELKLLDPPAESRWQSALQLLEQLGAVAPSGKVLEHGTELVRFGVHPRIGHLLLKARSLGFPRAGALVGALLESNHRLGQTLSGSALREQPPQIRHHAERLASMLGGTDRDGTPPYAKFLAFAYPERLGRRSSRGTYILAGGGEAKLPEGSSLSSSEFLAIGRLEMAGSSGRISLAEPISLEDIRDSYPIYSSRRLDDERLGALEVESVGELIISSKPVEITDEERIRYFLKALLNGELEKLLTRTELRSFLSRSEWGRTQGIFPIDWPMLDAESLKIQAEEIFSPYLSNLKRKSDLESLDILEILRARFSYDQLQRLEREVPENLVLSTGTTVPFEYQENGTVTLAVILQELFGRNETPQIAGKPVTLELLSPAKRPIQLTSSLESFWKTVYPELRRQLSRDYPRHYWPDDPLAASPVRRGLKSQMKSS